MGRQKGTVKLDGREIPCTHIIIESDISEATKVTLTLYAEVKASFGGELEVTEIMEEEEDEDGGTGS